MVAASRTVRHSGTVAVVQCVSGQQGNAWPGSARCVPCGQVQNRHYRTQPHRNSRAACPGVRRTVNLHSTHPCDHPQVTSNGHECRTLLAARTEATKRMLHSTGTQAPCCGHSRPWLCSATTHKSATLATNGILTPPSPAPAPSRCWCCMGTDLSSTLSGFRSPLGWGDGGPALRQGWSGGQSRAGEGKLLGGWGSGDGWITRRQGKIDCRK